MTTFCQRDDFVQRRVFPARCFFIIRKATKPPSGSGAINRRLAGAVSRLMLSAACGRLGV